MPSRPINYSECSVNELIDALEHVKDEIYPENALEIYTTLTTEKGLSREEILAHFDHRDGLRRAIDWLFVPITSEQMPTRDDIENKLTRISEYRDHGT